MARTHDTFTVIYRTGGTERYTWRRVLDNYANVNAAYDSALALERQGYATRVHKTGQLDRIGMPETYS